MKMKRIANNVALQTIGYVISGFTNVYIYVRECGYQKRDIYRGLYKHFARDEMNKYAYCKITELRADENVLYIDSFDEAQARFNDLRVSEEMPCVEFIKERIANGCIIGDEVLNVRQFTSVFDAITKDKPTLAGFLRSLPVIEAPWDGAFQERFCVECGADSCDDCPNEQFRNNPEWWLSLPAAGVEQ